MALQVFVVKQRISRTFGLGLIVAVLFFAGSAATCLAGDAPTLSAAEVQLSYRANESSWLAEYRLPRPVREFRFANTSAGTVRSDNWLIADADIDVLDDRLEAPTPFRDFAIRLPADAREHNRIYPAVISVGKGSLVNLSYLKGLAPTAIVISVDDGQVLVTPDDDSSVDRDSVAVHAPDHEAYYAYVGPGPVKAYDSFRMIAGGNVPRWLELAVREHMAAAIEEYAAFLGSTPEFTPTVYVSYLERLSISGWRGDTSKGGVMSLRFRERAWQHADREHVETIRKFVRHEVFHYWNHQSKVNSSKPWLHEGAAEYFAEYGTADLDALLQDCWVRGSPYACGHAANLIGDRLLAESGRATMKDAWAAVLRQEREYDVEDLLAAMGDLGAPRDFRDIIVGALDRPDASVRRSIVDRLQLDADGFEQIERRTRLSAGMEHILKSNCPGRHGFWTLENSLRLDASGCGGGLVDGAEVIAVDGASLADAAASEAIAAKCGTNEPIEFRGPKGESFDVTCPRPWNVR